MGNFTDALLLKRPMATAATPAPQPPTASNDTDPVVLVASARFVIRAETVPQGVRPRDVVPFLEGIVEEHSPLPIDHISWGYLGGKLTPKNREVLLYAAAKEQVFGGNRRPIPRRPTLPAFAALYGLRVKEPTWVFLLEQGCMTAALLQPGKPLPTRIHSRYLQTADEAGQWNARALLLAEVKPAAAQTLLPGLARIDAVRHDKSGRRISFQLKRQPAPGSNWEAWQSTTLAPLPLIEAADLRERAFLEAQKDEQRSGRSMKLGILFVLIALLAIIGLEATLYSRSAIAQELAEQAAKQEDAVKQLQQMEAMTKALEATLQRRSRPFELLLSASLKRPADVYFKSLTYLGGDQLRLTGEADNIQSVNTYADALRADGHWAEVELTEVRTEATGAATFQLRLKPHLNGVQPAAAATTSFNRQPTTGQPA